MMHKNVYFKLVFKANFFKQQKNQCFSKYLSKHDAPKSGTSKCLQKEVIFLLNHLRKLGETFEHTVSPPGLAKKEPKTQG